MPAFEVGKTHIDLLVNAGLQFVHPGDSLRWLVRELTDEEKQGVFQEGAPWGDGAINTYGNLFRELTDKSAGYVGAMLWAENRRSVNHRYAEKEWEQPYVYRRLHMSFDPVAVLSALSCYEYQSCEHPEWEKSEAYRYCMALQGAAVRRLPGYVAAPWHVSSMDDLENCRLKAA
ncbi:hypothetical protein [Streptomyces rimosus]|uniref:hypothetical protein n=1 Tax=Streptomyces rimosus TaxID=1927 RepID=UPI00067B9F33|nr:hypothetical protein [Streptomyces rimosus]